MPADPLLPDVSAGICLHMNNDMLEAVLLLRPPLCVEAPQSPRNAQVLPRGMETGGGRKHRAVPLITPSPDSEDAHRTLWPCCASMPKAEQAKG